MDAAIRDAAHPCAITRCIALIAHVEDIRELISVLSESCTDDVKAVGSMKR